MKPIPVYFINGFLGSGKTTALLKAADYFKRAGKKVAILLNELGNANLETHLFQKEQLYELLNGCICCSIQDDLKRLLQQMAVSARNRQLDILIIEGTGVANPGEVADIFTQPPFNKDFQLIHSVCVVDSPKLFDYVSIFSSAKEVRELQKAQLEQASVIVLNKIDRIENPQQLDKIEKIVKKYNDTAVIVKTEYGSDVPAVMQEKRNSSKLYNPSFEKIKHQEIKSIKLNQVKNVTKRDIANLLAELGDRLLRAKGIIQDKNDKEWYHFQYASGGLSWEKISNWRKQTAGEILLIGVNLRRYQIKV
ncbi:GTP-binding protein [Bacillaceae bacterium Marseille-Q3522]|nr:GTP-binding protein [Bacillaceae bacterium Marseille-Q3522]